MTPSGKKCPCAGVSRGDGRQGGDRRSAWAAQEAPGCLEEIARRIPFRLHLIGTERLEIPGVESTAQPWCAETEVVDLERLDIGLVPLLDNEWNRRRFNLKAAQYMALGVAPVATPLGSNPDIVDQGSDGSAMAERGARKAQAASTLAAQASAVVDAFSSAFTDGV